MLLVEGLLVTDTCQLHQDFKTTSPVVKAKQTKLTQDYSLLLFHAASSIEYTSSSRTPFASKIQSEVAVAGLGGWWGDMME